MSEPRYINRWQVDGSMQPFTANGAEMFGMFFTGGHEELTRLCDRYLNLEPTGAVRFEPLLDTIMLSFTNIDRVTASNPPFSQCGGNPEMEFTAWVLVRQLHTARIFLFAPYMLLNNPLAVQHGREIYGLPKEMAQFPRWGKDGFEVQAYSFPTCTPETNGAMRSILSVESSGDGFAAALWNDLGAARDALIAAGSLAQHLIPDDFIVPKGSLIALKQLPDTADSRYPSYQALIEADISVDVSHIRWVNVGTPHKYTLRLHNFWSHPFETDLGLRDGSESLFSYYVDYDFQLGVGRELWRAQT